MDPHPKFGLSVKTDDVTRIPRAYEEIYYYIMEAFWGKQGRPPKQAQNGSREQEMRLALSVYCG